MLPSRNLKKNSMENSGERLKKIRQEKGVSLEEAHRKTKIHLNILKAIEGDSLTDLNPVYLKGFLKIYCRFLGVDPKDYVPDYRETQSSIQDIGARKDEDKRSDIALKFSFLTNNPARFIKPLVIILIAFFFSLGLFRLGKSVAAKFKNKPAVTKPQPKPVTVVPKPAAAVQAATEAVPVKKKEAVPPIRLGIKTRENCWVSVKVDGKTVYQKVLEKGRSEFWNAKDKIELSLGNAGAVELEVNGSIFTNLGRRGQSRKNIVITKDGLNAGR